MMTFHLTANLLCTLSYWQAYALAPDTYLLLQPTPGEDVHIECHVVHYVVPSLYGVSKYLFLRAEECVHWDQVVEFCQPQVSGLCNVMPYLEKEFLTYLLELGHIPTVWEEVP